MNWERIIMAAIGLGLTALATYQSQWQAPRIRQATGQGIIELLEISERQCLVRVERCVSFFEGREIE